MYACVYTCIYVFIYHGIRFIVTSLPDYYHPIELDLYTDRYSCRKRFITSIGVSPSNNLTILSLFVILSLFLFSYTLLL